MDVHSTKNVSIGIDPYPNDYHSWSGVEYPISLFPWSKGVHSGRFLPHHHFKWGRRQCIVCPASFPHFGCYADRESPNFPWWFPHSYPFLLFKSTCSWRNPPFSVSPTSPIRQPCRLFGAKKTPMSGDQLDLEEDPPWPTNGPMEVWIPLGKSMQIIYTLW